MLTIGMLYATIRNVIIYGGIGVMKKTISILLVALMMLTLSIPTFAAKSPENPGEVIKVVVVAKKGGKATYQWCKDGTVKLIATPDKGHKFVLWKIDGEHTVVEGSTKTEIHIIDPHEDIYAVALFDNSTEVIVKHTKGGKVDYFWQKDGSLKLVATPDEGHTFTEWILDGKYEVVKGNKKNEIIILNPTSDKLEVTALFDDETKVIEPTKDDVSPDTGYTLLPAVLVAAVSMFGAAYCVKRSKED